jgi:3-deoxy-D-manno-octulosonic-acid transferase
MSDGYYSQTRSAKTDVNIPKKGIMLVVPTIGEVFQSHRLCNEINKLFCDSPLCAIVDDNEAYHVAKSINEIDNILVYQSDTSFNADSVLNKTNPIIIIFMENCYYPQLLIEAEKRNITTLLISAVMNDTIRCHPRYKECFLMDAYKLFSSVGVKSSMYIKEFVGLGVEENKIFVTGDLKIDPHRLSISEDERGYYDRIMGLTGKSVFIAGSVSQDEGEIILDVCEKLRSVISNLKCIIAPRFLDNIKDLKKYAEKTSLSVATKTDLLDGKADKDEIDVILLDAYGELGKFYGLGDAIFVGGTLKPFADKPLGQNILEPLFHCKPIVVGPNVKKDFDVIKRLQGFWPDIIAKDSSELFNGISFLLLDEGFRGNYFRFIKDSIKFDCNMSGLTKTLSGLRDKVVTTKMTC